MGNRGGYGKRGRTRKGAMMGEERGEGQAGEREAQEDA